MNLRELGLRIKRQREKYRLTQADVANALQISAQAVSKWERGENAPDIALLLDLAKLLSVSTDWLLGRDSSSTDTFPATVLCTGINGFAKRSTELAPREVAAWANGVFHLLTEAVLRFDGVPVKYVGDGFLAFFSGPLHANRAFKAVMHGRTVTNNPDLVAMLHSGEIYLGAIGHSEYARPDIIGETVNTAFLAMNWVAAHLPLHLGLSNNVVIQLTDKIAFKKPVKASIAGLKEPLTIYTPTFE